MKFFTLFTALFVLTGVDAQRPANISICDYYTTGLLKNNTAENQCICSFDLSLNNADTSDTLLKLVVNTVALGNYTTDPAPLNAVPGILAPGEVNGTAVNLAPYFMGTSGNTSNRGGVAVSGINFLDGGGATPLLNNTLPPNGTNQYLLVTHLYQYFGGLLGCSMMGTADFPAYSGHSSQYNVHKFMDLTYAQTTYFINQVALSASSFGVAESDIAAVGKSLNGAFNVRCAPNASIPSTSPASPQSICIANDCPLAANASCAAYGQTQALGVGPNSTVVNAGNVSSAASAASASGSSSRSSGSSSSSSSTGASSDARGLRIGTFGGLVAILAALI